MTTQAIQKASEVVGSYVLLARAAGVSRAMVHQWARGVRQVAAERCPLIERATGGAVRCEDLRPDVDWGYLRATDCDVPKVGAGDTAPADLVPAPARAMACVNQSARLTADRRQLTRREEPPEAAPPDQLPLLDDGDSDQEAA